MNDFENHVKQFASLRRATNTVFTESTMRKAPHKPILLLAVLDMIHRGSINSSFITVTGEIDIAGRIRPSYLTEILCSRYSKLS